MRQHNAEHGDRMLVKLILSVDRARSLSESRDVLHMAAADAQQSLLLDGAERSARTVVGIDFSGNPYGGRFEDFLPIFEEVPLWCCIRTLSSAAGLLLHTHLS